VSEEYAIASGQLTARVAALGAELLSLTDAGGREYMTDADPRWWTGHAPVLFPIVGALERGRYRLDDKEYMLEKHGFARKSGFACEEHEEAWTRLALEDSAASRAVYPFAFRLELLFEIAATTLAVTAAVTNRDSAPMPFSFGFHPAFAWPLPGGAAKDAHRIVFEKPEPEPVRRIGTDEPLLLPGRFATPVEGRTLHPLPELFEADALIWDTLHSRAASWGAAGGGSLDLAFPDSPNLGVWQKPGAPFLAIEPWHGYNDPVGFDGDFRDKPGIVVLAPGASRAFRLSITINPPSGEQP